MAGLDAGDAAEVAGRARRAGCCAFSACLVPLIAVVNGLKPVHDGSALPPLLQAAIWLTPVALLTAGAAAALALTAATLLQRGDHRRAMGRLQLAALLVTLPGLLAIPVELGLIAYGIYADVAVQSAEKAGVPEAGCGMVLVLFIFAVAAGVLAYIVPALVAGLLLRRVMAALVRATRSRLP